MTEAAADFELVGQPSDDSSVVLGLWRVGLEADGDEPPVWRVNLSDRNVRDLAAAGAHLRAIEEAVPTVAMRLEGVLGREHEVGLSFGLPTGPSPGEPEEELLSWLAAAGRVTPGVSFAAEGAPDAGWWREQGSAATTLAGRVRRWCAPRAWVETDVDGIRLARSLIGIGGSTRTAVAPGLGREHLAAHSRAVALALASRVTVLRTVSTAMAGAIGISAKLALPGGSVLALPAAWRFVQRALFRSVPR